MPSLIETAVVRGRSRLISCCSVAPLRILETAGGEDGTVRAVLASYGGGLLQGDHLDLEILCRAGSRLHLTTQSNTQIYENNGGPPARQSLRGVLDEGAAAHVLPLSNVMHRNSRFIQDQDWEVAAGASLVLADLFQAGRVENAESFRFHSYESRCILRRNGRPFLEEAFRFEPDRHDPFSAACFGPFRAMLSLYLVGPGAALPRQRLERYQQDRKGRGTPAGDVRHPPLSALYPLPVAEAHVFRMLGVTHGDLEEVLALVEG